MSRSPEAGRPTAVNAKQIKKTGDDRNPVVTSVSSRVSGASPVGAGFGIRQDC
jgi:hypothetical protein